MKEKVNGLNFWQQIRSNIVQRLPSHLKSFDRNSILLWSASWTRKELIADLLGHRTTAWHIVGGIAWFMWAGSQPLTMHWFLRREDKLWWKLSLKRDWSAGVCKGSATAKRVDSWETAKYNGCRTLKCLLLEMWWSGSEVWLFILC